ncbi:hypothetical protein [Nocardiopsis ansamitocini]|uniref:Bacterial Pleckstrin homology domain-containing protein n=1 Tax=Nocardiopsis ansamitocini TaxID=1670832 RepID=A0A9W6PB58_9ACTN|nr:hypothetical protein [Nocardiopsis ansamitocini]GLU50301.1 hypothetical protein Nans01_46520 [Nocardiopsis ansamitocini]
MSRNRVTVTDGHLVVEPLGLDKAWSFTRRLQIPLAHVRGASFDPDVMHEPKGVRAPGLHLPGKLSGTFHAKGKKNFWNVSGDGPAIVVGLDSTERFDRLILTVDDPAEVIDTINSALGAR